MAEKETFVQKLSEIMLKHHIIGGDEEKAIQKAFRDSSKPSFVNFLLEQGLVSRPAMLNILSEYYNVPAFDVVGQFFSRQLLNQIPQGVLIRNKIIPLRVDENMLIVVASEPDNPELLPKIGEHVSYDVRFLVGLEQDIIDAVREFYEMALTEVPEALDRREAKEQKEEAEGIIISDEED